MWREGKGERGGEKLEEGGDGVRGERKEGREGGRRLMVILIS